MLTKEKVEELLEYEKETGRLIWKVKRGSTATPGTCAGTEISNGRRQMSIDGERYYTSHIVWLLHKGRLPDKDKRLDHRNRIPSDDRIDNLRELSNSENVKNSDRSDGITSSRDVFVEINGNRKFIGSYETVEEKRAAVRAVLTFLGL
jgi:hypothetical protein